MSNISKIWDNHWDKIGDLRSFLDIEKTQDNWTKHHFNLIDNKLKKLSQRSIFLEAGCGLGQWCIYASQKYGIKSIGVDIATNTLKKLDDYIRINKLKNIEFLEDDLNNTRLPSDAFDFFVSLGVIEHFYDSKKMLDNLFKVTKKGGEGLISVPNIYSIHTVTRPISKLLGKWKIGYEKSFSPKQLKILVENSGFEVMHFGVIPSGEMFGVLLNSVPLFGKMFNKLSYLIESHQKTWGFISYVWVKRL